MCNHRLYRTTPVLPLILPHSNKLNASILAGQHFVSVIFSALAFTFAVPIDPIVFNGNIPLRNINIQLIRRNYRLVVSNNSILTQKLNYIIAQLFFSSTLPATGALRAPSPAINSLINRSLPLMTFRAFPQHPLSTIVRK